MNEVTEGARNVLAADIKALANDTGEFLRSTTQEAGQQIGKVRNRVGDRLARTRAGMQAFESAAREKTRATAKATDEYVHAHPWQALGIAAGAGLLLGLLLKRH